MPTIPSVFQEIVASCGPKNISYILRASAPDSSTTLSGFTMLPLDLDILSPSGPKIIPCGTRFAYGSGVGTSFWSNKNKCQNLEYNKCKVVCSIPPKYKSTGSQCLSFLKSANFLLFFESI